MEADFVNYLLQLEAGAQSKTLEENFSGNVYEPTGFGDGSQLSEWSVIATHKKNPRDHKRKQTNKPTNNNKTYHPVAPVKILTTFINSNVESPPH